MTLWRWLWTSKIPTFPWFSKSDTVLFLGQHYSTNFTSQHYSTNFISLTQHFIWKEEGPSTFSARLLLQQYSELLYTTAQSSEVILSSALRIHTENTFSLSWTRCTIHNAGSKQLGLGIFMPSSNLKRQSSCTNEASAELTLGATIQISGLSNALQSLAHQIQGTQSQQEFWWMSLVQALTPKKQL